MQPLLPSCMYVIFYALHTCVQFEAVALASETSAEGLRRQAVKYMFQHPEVYWRLPLCGAAA